MSTIAIVLFVVVALLNDPAERSPTLGSAMECAGFGLLIVATLGRIWTGAYLGGRKTKELCLTGPFSVVRNPLYFFSMLAAIGLGFMTGSLVLLGSVLVAFVVYYHFIIRDEETRLVEAFGEPFREYCRRVPRLLPNWRLYTDETTVVLHTKQFRKTILDTSLFIWIVFIFEVCELLSAVIGHRVMPVAWHLF
jgi:protein-S-isoprenylcysteine O-methyltransferase Ste14